MPVWGTRQCASHVPHQRVKDTPQRAAHSMAWVLLGCHLGPSMLPFLGMGLLRRIWGHLLLTLPTARVVPVWERSFASGSGAGISVLVNADLQRRGCWWEMLGDLQLSSMSWHVVVIKSLPRRQCPWGCVPKGAEGTQGAVSILAPASRLCLGRAGNVVLELPALLHPGVCASWRGWRWLLLVPWPPQLVEVPSSCPLLCQATLSCPQLSQGHSVTWVMLSSFPSCWGSGACWAPPAPLWPQSPQTETGAGHSPQLCSLLLCSCLSPQPLTAPSEAAGPR